MDEQVLIRAGGVANRMVSRDVIGWPPPERLGHLPVHDVWLMPDQVERLGGEFDDMIDYYVKVSESQITDEQIAVMNHVVRGAQYEREPR